MTARNLTFGIRNRIIGATLSGGSWVADGDVALANVQDLRLRKVARSTDDATASTVIVADLGATFDLGIFGIAQHNASAAATLRVRVASSEGNLTAAPAWDSTAQAIWRGSDTPATNLGEGGLPIHQPVALVVPDAAEEPATGRWVRFDISDTSNPDGHLEPGYLMAWETWRPDRNRSFGEQRAPEAGTIGEPSIGQVWGFDRRAAPIGYRFVHERLGRADADRALDVMLERDLDQPWFVLPDPDDPTSWLRSAFLARARKLGALELAQYRRWNVGADFLQIVGG